MTVAEGPTGYLVPPRDPEALAERLAALLRYPRLRMKFGRQGQHRAARLFTWERVAAAIERLYLDVIQSAGVSAADRGGASLSTG